MSRAAPSAWRQPAASPASAEDRHQAVAQILVDPAAAPLDGLADLREQPVEDEHHVVGQPRLADGGEVARVEEQHRQRALDPLDRPAARMPGVAPVRRRDEARDGDGVLRADLAGESHVRRRHDACERHGFGAARRRRSARPLSTPTRQVEQRARPPHTEACGTSLMRLISSSVGPGGPAPRSAAIGDLDLGAGGAAHARTSRHQRASASNARNARRSRSCSVARRAAGRCIGRARGGLQLVPGPRRPIRAATSPARHREAGQRRDRQRHRQREQHRAHARVPGGETQPVVHADAAVHPHAPAAAPCSQARPGQMLPSS